MQTTGTASDDFLVTGDTCTGATIASGGDATCAVRVRFAPSEAGPRAAALRVRHGAGAAYDVPLSATATAAAASTTTATTDVDTPAATTSPTTATTPSLTPPPPRSSRASLRPPPPPPRGSS